jgi:hypothetical protein
VLRSATLAASDVIISHPDPVGKHNPAQLRLGIVSLAPAQFPKAKILLQTATNTGSAIADLPEFAPVRGLQPRRAAVSRRARAWCRSCLNARARPYSLHRSCSPMAVAVALNLRPSACHRNSSKLFAAVKPVLPVPRFHRLERSSPCWKCAGEELTPPAHDRIEMGSFPVISFVCAYVPGTTRSTHPSLQLPC